MERNLTIKEINNKGNICNKCGCVMSMLHGWYYGNCVPINDYRIMSSEEVSNIISKDNPFINN